MEVKTSRRDGRTNGQDDSRSRINFFAFCFQNLFCILKNLFCTALFIQCGQFVFFVALSQTRLSASKMTQTLCFLLTFLRSQLNPGGFSPVFLCCLFVQRGRSSKLCFRSVYFQNLASLPPSINIRLIKALHIRCCVRVNKDHQQTA